LSQSVEDATKTKRFMVIKHSSPGAQDMAMDSASCYGESFEIPK
jgi:hypothetical protein